MTTIELYSVSRYYLVQRGDPIFQTSISIYRGIDNPELSLYSTI